MIVPTLPRETSEFMPVVITVDAVAVTSGVAFALVTNGARPTTWVPATVLGPETLVFVSGLSVGVYTLFAQVTAGAEVAVIEVGALQIT